MTKPSCLNCAFGKDKEQKPGFYCGGEGSHADVYHFTPHKLATISHPDRNHHHVDWATGDCNHYKPRQNKCQADGCKWWGDFCEHEGHRWFEEVHLGKVQCNDFKKQEETMDDPGCLTCLYGDPTNTGTYFCKNPWMIEQNNPGGICWHNEGIPICAKHKQEETMETIKVNGKVYKRNLDKPFTFENLKGDTQGNSHTENELLKFAIAFDIVRDLTFYPEASILLTPARIEWLKPYIPWLVKKGYLREVVEEKQLPNQWYEVGDRIYYSTPDLNFVCMKGEAGSTASVPMAGCLWTSKAVPITPLITEQPDTAERRPELCVHNDFGTCRDKAATQYFSFVGSFQCRGGKDGTRSLHKDCPKYTPK